jgi:hypothetical protein
MCASPLDGERAEGWQPRTALDSSARSNDLVQTRSDMQGLMELLRRSVGQEQASKTAKKPKKGIHPS